MSTKIDNIIKIMKKDYKKMNRKRHKGLPDEETDRYENMSEEDKQKLRERKEFLLEP